MGPPFLQIGKLEGVSSLDFDSVVAPSLGYVFFYHECIYALHSSRKTTRMEFTFKSPRGNKKFENYCHR
jgi:hypothetical protein